MNDVQIVAFVVVIGISILIFLVLREVLTWYWKINKIVGILENQTELLSKIIKAIQDNKN